MATPMRSTDFRSIVEPILNEVFDGIYEQRADEWAEVFGKSIKAFLDSTMKNQFFMVLMWHQNYQTVWQ